MTWCLEESASDVVRESPHGAASTPLVLLNAPEWYFGTLAAEMHAQGVFV